MPVNSAVFYQYFMPNVLIMAAALFLAFRRLGETHSGEPGRVVSTLSSLSFGVYLIHEVFLRVLQPLTAGMFNTLAIVLQAVLVFVLSLGTSFLLMHTPMYALLRWVNRPCVAWKRLNSFRRLIPAEIFSTICTFTFCPIRGILIMITLLLIVIGGHCRTLWHSPLFYKKKRLCPILFCFMISHDGRFTH